MQTALQVAASVRLAGVVVVDEPVRLFAGCSLSDSQIGAFSYVSPGTSLHSVSVGRYCSIGDGVQILSQHPHGSLTTSPFSYQRLFSSPFDAEPLHDYTRVLPTKIGNDVWIGSGAKNTIRNFLPVIYFEAKRMPGTVSSIELLQRCNYRCYWHFAHFFRSDNFRGNSVDVFRGVGDMNVLAVPQGKPQPDDLPEINSAGEDWREVYAEFFSARGFVTP